MTLNDAIRLQEHWKASHDGENCQHNQLFDHLWLNNSGEADYKV